MSSHTPIRPTGNLCLRICCIISSTLDATLILFSRFVNNPAYQQGYCYVTGQILKLMGEIPIDNMIFGCYNMYALLHMYGTSCPYSINYIRWALACPPGNQVLAHLVPFLCNLRLIKTEHMFYFGHEIRIPLRAR